MSRHILVQSVLLPRLLAAIGAGSLLAAPGCGGKTQASAGEATNGVDGQETGKDATTTNANTLTTTDGKTTIYIVSPTASVGNPTEPTPAQTGSAVNPTHTATATSGPTGPTATTSYPTSTDEPLETRFDAGSTVETTQPATEPDARVVDAVDAGSNELPVYECEFGEPASFCVSVEAMENQARWGVGDLQPEEPLRSDDEIAAGWDKNGCMNHEWIASGCCNPALGPGEPQKDGTCCYVACEGACCGRPFIVNGRVLVADIVERADWQATPAELCVALNDLSTMERETLAQAWLADAQMEHASIASFSRFALDLLQLGAPPELLHECHLAGLDEIEHARFGFSMASKLMGRDVGPGILTSGNFEAHSLEQTIVAAIVEGCVGETLAAGVVAEQARRCTDEQLSAQLAKIADDELRHSELAWRFVAWALQRFGTQAQKVLESAFVQALAKTPEAPADLGLSSVVLHSLGRITSHEWQNAVEQVLREVIAPALAALTDVERVRGAQKRSAFASTSSS